METLNGGWTVIQKRVDGSTSFDKLWSEYKEGFGSPEQNVWIGNDVIHQLTKGNGSSLYVSITQVSGTTLYELYGRFSIANEAEKYRLFLAGNVTGTLGDSMLNTIDPDEHDLSGMYFSTHDNNNDLSGGFNCAAEAGGGWWFRDCYSAFLNGLWSSTAWANPWAPTIRSGTSVSKTLMMIKRH
ncbi:fibroleukin-like [Saccostrea echinata]|uniref:fibroleukin-like n=1 Tax=Saccostrea echinata TaxID=191078 RepID=UPI002A821819|nr:fibroleukin-like [Saccostrea echinata]